MFKTYFLRYLDWFNDFNAFEVENRRPLNLHTYLEQKK